MDFNKAGKFGGRPAERTRALDYVSSLANLKELISRAEDNVTNDWEEQFVGDMYEKMMDWGTDMFMSHKQFSKLSEMAAGDNGMEHWQET